MSGRRPRAMSGVDRALWRHAMRDVEPLPGNALPPEPKASVPEVAAEKPAPAPTIAASPPRSRPQPTPLQLPTLTYARTPGLDRRTAERLKRGQLPIEARLDLHGMTQDEARRSLDGFITQAHDRGLRAVLIITGKGLKPREPAYPWDHSTGGVLKAMTPRWLNEAPNRGRVLAITEAQPRHGGSGALYVLIRRQRE